MTIETKLKLEKYLPFIKCCNDGNLKVSWSQVFQAIIIFIMATVVSALYVSHNRLSEVCTDVVWIKAEMIKQNALITGDHQIVLKNYDKTTDQGERIGKLEATVDILKNKERNR